MTTTTTQSASSTLQPTMPSRSRVGIALSAFLAILRRDIVVTGREFIAFLLQVLYSEDAGALAVQATQAVAQVNAELRDLHLAHPSLEDVFIYLTGRNLR